MHLPDLEARETAVDVHAHIERIVAQGSDLFESWHRTKAGEVWSVEVNTSHWPEAGGRFFAFVRDITERKAAENELHRRNEELERFNRATVGRELDMVELKKRINALSRELGHAAPFQLDFLDDAGDGP
jgi:hypothetical protein